MRDKKSDVKNTCYKVSMTLFLCFILFILQSLHTVSAHVDDSLQATEQCQGQINHIAVSKNVDKNNQLIPNANWITLDGLPDFWSKRWPNYHGNAWYKITWQYDCPTSQTTPISLVVSNINMAGQVFLNDELLWQDQSLHEPLSRSWQTPRSWILPASSLKKGENIIWIRVVGIATQRSGLGEVLIGDQITATDHFNNLILEKRTLLISNVMINFVLGLFCLLVWLLHSKEKAFVWFALVSLSWVLYVGIILSQKPIFSLPTATIDRITIFIFCCYSVFGYMAAWRFANRRYPLIEKFFCIFCIIAGLCLFLVPNIYLPFVLNSFFVFAVIIFLLKCLTYPFIAYQVKQPEIYFLAFTYVTFFPIAINDAYFMITHEGRALSPYTSPFSTLFIGIILALRLARNAKRIEQFNKTLEDSVILARNELTNALNTQHQLAIENTKLQERINLAHDLHDGLGGSIVRSMIMLDHNEKVDKPHMMSMLKLLRNDLRQVIDSGSSIGAKVPESPIIWAAPIRHRFIQIFEDMEIESTWVFAHTWKTIPSSLQCLTLSRVAEEALTNIVKHSQATQVDVSLLENGQQLLFEITDNGIGFNPDNVEEGLHVGLQSMQARIQRIGGTLSIVSISGHTTIRVVITLIPSL